MNRPAANELTRLLKFGTVGLAQNALCFVGYLALEPALQSHTWAMTVAYVAGLSLAYLGNSIWTFEARSRNATALPRFVTLYALGYAWSLLVHLVLVDEVGMHHALVQAITIVTCAAMMYAGQRLWVFRTSTAERS